MAKKFLFRDFFRGIQFETYFTVCNGHPSSSSTHRTRFFTGVFENFEISEIRKNFEIFGNFKIFGIFRIQHFGLFECSNTSAKTSRKPKNLGENIKNTT